jgi:hypothetical protein
MSSCFPHSQNSLCHLTCMLEGFYKSLLCSDFSYLANNWAWKLICKVPWYFRYLFLAFLACIGLVHFFCPICVPQDVAGILKV